MHPNKSQKENKSPKNQTILQEIIYCHKKDLLQLDTKSKLLNNQTSETEKGEPKPGGKSVSRSETEIIKMIDKQIRNFETATKNMVKV